MTTEKTNKVSHIVLASFAVSFIFGFFYVCTIYYSLPRSDGAHGQGLIKMILDPFVLTIALTYILLTGLFFSPVCYYCLRLKNLRTALPIILSAGIIWIVVITPFTINGGLLGFYFIYLLALIFCRFARVNFLKIS